MRTKIKRRDNYFVYILECTTGAYYTGYTNNIDARIKLHNSGHGSKFLRGKTPVKLVFLKSYINYKCALNEERRIKSLSRAKKEKLIGLFRKSP